MVRWQERWISETRRQANGRFGVWARGARRLGIAPSRRRLGLLRGPDKYTVLDQRRRAAQIRARHAMDLIDVMERAGEGR